MKTLIIIGVLLIITGATLASSTGISGAWMVQTGLIFLFGAIAVSSSRKEKIWMPLSTLFMVALFLWGFVNGMWYIHPLGAIISIAGGGWVVYHITRGKKYGTENLRDIKIKMPEFTQKLLPSVKRDIKIKMPEFTQKLLPSVKQHIKWVGVPLSILLALWLSKSILLAFVVGFGIVAFLDRKLIQTKGLNRVVILLIVYSVGFFLLLVVTFKVANTYFERDLFFSRDSYILLRGIMRGL